MSDPATKALQDNNETLTQPTVSHYKVTHHSSKCVVLLHNICLLPEARVSHLATSNHSFK